MPGWVPQRIPTSWEEKRRRDAAARAQPPTGPERVRRAVDQLISVKFGGPILAGVVALGLFAVGRTWQGAILGAVAGVAAGILTGGVGMALGFGLAELPWRVLETRAATIAWTFLVNVAPVAVGVAVAMLISGLF
jgi:hypothetical protein